MLAVGIVVIWAGYGVGSYGWLLIKGQDVPLRAWFSPLNPYQWPEGGPPTIPDSQLFPGSPAPAAAPPGNQAGSGAPPPPAGGPGIGDIWRKIWSILG